MSNLKELSPNVAAPCTAIQEFSMAYDNYAPSTSNAVNGSVQNEKKFTRNWLANHVPLDLVESLVNMLKSQKSSDELQNELFDMLGFDKFEAIQEILQNRNVIVKVIESGDKKQQLKEKALMQKINRPQVRHEENLKPK